MSSVQVNPNSIRAIAKKDFQDAVRSWLFWGLSIFFFLLMVAVTAVMTYIGDDVGLGTNTEALVRSVTFTTRIVIPLIALILGWKSIAGERESGSIKLLLSLPHSRTDMVLGKLLGRSAVLSLSLIAGFGLAAIVVAALLGGFDILDYIGLLAASVFYGVAYTSIAVSLSSLTRSTTIAGASAFGVFLLFYVVWNAISTAGPLLAAFDYIPVVETSAGVRLPLWYYAILLIDPGAAYSNTLSFVTSAAGIEGATDVQAELFGGSLPIFLQDWFSLVILLCWIAIPITIAVYRFDQVDL